MTAKTPKFWNWMAERYAKSPIADEASYQAKLAKTLEYVDQNTRVGELGCGTGSTAIFIAPHVREIVASDFAENMIAIARRKAEAAGLTNADFRVGSMEVLDGQFDAFLCHSILHLVHNPQDIIAEASSKLKPGGVLISSTACVADMGVGMKILLPFLRWPWLGLTPYARTKHEMRAMYRKAGLEIIHDWQPGKKAALFLIGRKN
ncbi:class I SAM-dependent methyltransferase [Marivivens donghaensis]|uniref:Class I SAM-dependent methyltransferase n=1 Tax=Marivivens donghaensis TaxID=1699413 RepID=A0ABX0VSY4_9RHOB|nr:class I SAM-dependent methyltransferase [Marivivens donghaensis]NIY70985.1 class I SAM-dependent methyltransferase [Marivivens donghaensis]